MTDRENIKNIIELFIAWNGETEVIDIANLDSAVDFIINSLPEEPVKSLDVDEIKLILDINSDMQEELENSTMFPPEWAGTEKYYEELLKRYESRR